MRSVCMFGQRKVESWNLSEQELLDSGIFLKGSPVSQRFFTASVITQQCHSSQERLSIR